jgi:prephenate dehydrogenase
VQRERMMGDTLTIALIGCGQIGGSLALALKSSDATLRILGYDTALENAVLLQEKGGLDGIASSLTDAIKMADIIVLATPLRSYEPILKEAAPHIAAHTVITDVGSVKTTLIQLRALLPASVAIVPAHPIAGSEQAGARVARADLYQDKLCVLTPEIAEESDHTRIIQHLWEAAGATVRFMPADIHDQLYAYVSHLPHLIAFIAARQFYKLNVRIHEHPPLLAQFLRISRSTPRMWADIFIENRDALLQSIAMFTAVLSHIATELEQGNSAAANEDYSIPATARIAVRVLPHLLASSLISTVSLYEQQSGIIARNFSAGGLRDIAAPAAESPEEMAEYISQHSACVARLVRETLALFVPLQEAIAHADAALMLQLLESLRADAVAINR